MPQIELIDITKTYGPDQILDGVSFSIASGEFVFLIGSSGAGKSTIIKLLTREELPDVGQILFNEESILEYPDSRIPELKRKMGVVFQDFKLLESKTVFDNVAVALEVVDASVEEINNVVPNVLNLVGLSHKKDAYPRQLSGGEKQRVSIARALAHEPDVLIADEPTGMIDPDSAEEVLEILEKVNSLGTTVLMATHDENIVNKMKKRVIRVSDGKISLDKKGGKYRD